MTPEELKKWTNYVPVEKATFVRKQMKLGDSKAKLGWRMILPYDIGKVDSYDFNELKQLKRELGI